MHFTFEQEQEFASKFYHRGYENPIEASGCYCPDINGFDINCSSILTRLIQEAGRYCEQYASDLFFDWTQIDRLLSDGCMQTQSFLFGFRESGVDHIAFILSKGTDPCYEYQYRSVWKLDVVREKDSDPYCQSRNKLTMRLYRVGCPSSHLVRKFIEKCRKEDTGEQI